MTVTLRIKKYYFDQIAAGKKNVEYRDVKPFYRRLLKDKRVDFLILHYQKRPRLLCHVRKIEIQKTPQSWREEGWRAKRYAFHLGDRESYLA